MNTMHISDEAFLLIVALFTLDCACKAGNCVSTASTYMATLWLATGMPKELYLVASNKLR